MLIPDGWIAQGWIEACVVVACTEADESIWAKPDGFESGCIISAAREDEAELFIEGTHQCSTSSRGESVVEEFVDVGGEIGVVNADDGDTHQFGGEHPGHAHWTRG